MKTLNTAIFLFKDEHYNYMLIGNELHLCPLGHRREQRYLLSDSEVSQMVEYYVTPLEELRNKYPYIEGFYDEILDIEDDMVVFIDHLTIYAKRIK